MSVTLSLNCRECDEIAINELPEIWFTTPNGPLVVELTEPVLDMLEDVLRARSERKRSKAAGEVRKLIGDLDEQSAAAHRRLKEILGMVPNAETPSRFDDGRQCGNGCGR